MSTDCDAALMHETTYSEQWQIKEMCAIFSLITESNYEEAKHNLGISVPGYFDGNYDDFSKKRTELKNQFNYTYSRDESRSIAQAYLPSEAYEAWSTCMSGQSGLKVGVKDITDDTATLEVIWTRPTGVGGLVSRGVSLANGASPVADNFSGNDPFDGAAAIIVPRHPTKDVAGFVTGDIHNGGATSKWTQRFLIPAAQKSEPPKHPQSIDGGAKDDVSLLVEAQPYNRMIEVEMHCQVKWGGHNGSFTALLYIDEVEKFKDTHPTGLQDNHIRTKQKFPLAAFKEMKIRAHTDGVATINQTLELKVDA